jgi:hypothetical protein
VQVVGGVIPASFEPVGVALLEKYPLLRAMCASERARSAPASLAALTLSLPMQSLLTVYAQYQQDRLDHIVGVAMLAMSLARRLLPGDIDRHRVLATTGQSAPVSWPRGRHEWLPAPSSPMRKPAMNPLVAAWHCRSLSVLNAPDGRIG